MRPGLFPSLSSTAPAMAILPMGLLPCPPPMGSFFVRKGIVELVDLDNALKRVAVRVNHRLAESVKQEPSALVRTDAELRLKLKRRDAVRVRRDQMRREKPSAKRKVRGVHDGSGRYRNLFMALGALPMVRLRFQPPALFTFAMRTAKAVRPTLLGEVFGAGGIVRKHRHELLQRRRLILGPAGGLFEGLAHEMSLAELSTPSHRNH